MFVANQFSLNHRQRFLRILLTTLSGVMVVSSLCYAQGWKNPVIHCYFQDVFGFIGPGCGLTRSVVWLLHGQWSMAIKYHLFGPILFLMASGLLIWAVSSLIFNQRLVPTDSIRIQSLALMVFACLFWIAFWGYYGLRLMALYAEPLIPETVTQLAIWNFLASGTHLLM
jgi:hypothetical protein